MGNSNLRAMPYLACYLCLRVPVNPPLSALVLVLQLKLTIGVCPNNTYVYQMTNPVIMG